MVQVCSFRSTIRHGLKNLMVRNLQLLNNGLRLRLRFLRTAEPLCCGFNGQCAYFIEGRCLHSEVYEVLRSARKQTIHLKFFSSLVMASEGIWKLSQKSAA